MIRSVMIKGIEALTLECFLAASRAGVLDEVTASLKNNYPGLDWAKLSEYNLERMASHGERRAAEMEESAATLRELGLDPLMVEATVKRQREMGAIGKAATRCKPRSTQGRAAILRAISARQEAARIDFLNARSCCRSPLRAQNSCQHWNLASYYVRSIQLGRNTMKLRKLGYAALVAAAAAVIAIGSAVPSEAKTKKKKAAAAPRRRRLCLIVEHQPVCGVKGGTEVHLRQRAATPRRRRQGGLAAGLPGRQDGQAAQGQEGQDGAGQEERRRKNRRKSRLKRAPRKQQEDVEPFASSKTNGPLRKAAARSRLRRPPRITFARRNLDQFRELLLGQRLVQEFELHRVA